MTTLIATLLTISSCGENGAKDDSRNNNTNGTDTANAVDPSIIDSDNDGLSDQEEANMRWRDPMIAEIPRITPGSISLRFRVPMKKNDYATNVEAHSTWGRVPPLTSKNQCTSKVTLDKFHFNAETLKPLDLIKNSTMKLQDGELLRFYKNKQLSEINDSKDFMIQRTSRLRLSYPEGVTEISNAKTSLKIYNNVDKASPEVVLPLILDRTMPSYFRTSALKVDDIIVSDNFKFINKLALKDSRISLEVKDFKFTQKGKSFQFSNFFENVTRKNVNYMINKKGYMTLYSVSASLTPKEAFKKIFENFELDNQGNLTSFEQLNDKCSSDKGVSIEVFGAPRGLDSKFEPGTNIVISCAINWNNRNGQATIEDRVAPFKLLSTDIKSLTYAKSKVLVSVEKEQIKPIMGQGYACNDDECEFPTLISCESTYRGFTSLHVDTFGIENPMFTQDMPKVKILDQNEEEMSFSGKVHFANLKEPTSDAATLDLIPWKSIEFLTTVEDMDEEIEIEIIEKGTCNGLKAVQYDDDGIDWGKRVLKKIYSPSINYLYRTKN